MRKPVVFWILLFLIVFSAAAPLPVRAQTPPPPNLPAPPLPPEAPLPPELTFSADGLAPVIPPEFAAAYGLADPTLSAESSPPASPQAASGSARDAFGYRRAAVPMQWVDARSTGTDLGINTSLGRADLTLPFAFPFYDQTYTVIPVIGAGNLSLGDGSAAAQSYLPHLRAPNGVIAPYWTRFYFSDNPGADGRVYTLSGIWPTGLEAGLQFTAVEWHKVQDPYYNQFTFEVVLFENGTILFQYLEMLSPKKSWECAVAGIENQTGSLGLVSLRYCEWQPSQKAWKFTRPKPSARVRVSSPSQGGFTQPGGSLSYTLEVQNTGDLGPDTFDLSVSSPWPVTLFQSDGLTPLGDSNGNQKPDTGPLAQSEAAQITLQVTPPPTTPPGRAKQTVITLRSSLNHTVSAQTTLTTAVPTSFALALSGDRGAQILQAAPQSQLLHETSYAANLYLLPDNTYLQFGTGWGCVDESCAQYTQELRYTRLGYDGALLTPPETLTNNGNNPNAYSVIHTAAPTADGRTALLFERIEKQPDPLTYRINVILGILDLRPGEPLWTEIPLTSNTDFYLSGQLPYYYGHLSLAALPDPDPRWVAVWQQWQPDDSKDGLWDVWGAALGLDGSLLTAPTQLTSGGDDHYYPQALTLSSGAVLLSWLEYRPDRWWLADQMVVSVWNADLTPRTTPRRLGKANTPADMVQLPNGKILIAWGRKIGDWRSGPKYRFAYTLLKPTSLARAAPVRALSKPKSYEPDALAVGVTYDEQGNGILLWNSSGPPQRDIFFTRVSRSSGAVLTATMPIAAGIGNPNILINPREGLTTNLPPAP